MGVVTYTPVPTASVPTGTDVYGSFYTIKGNSLEVINGSLEAANLLDFEADYTMLQHNSTSGGGMVAGTANLDYFSGNIATDGWFSGMGNPEEVDPAQMLPVPGASLQFYLPYDAFVLLTWQITWVTDIDASTTYANARLVIDGNRPGTREVTAADDVSNALASPNVRRSGKTVFVSTVGAAGTEHIRDRYKSRYWCGHQWLDNLDQGWHSASLRVAMRGGIFESRQMRVRARSMKYIYFKREGK